MRSNKVTVEQGILNKINSSMKVTKKQLVRILNSKKDFILYDLDLSDRLTNYILTNDYKAHKDKYQKFRVLETIQSKYEITIV